MDSYKVVNMCKKQAKSRARNGRMYFFMLIDFAFFFLIFLAFSNERNVLTIFFLKLLILISKSKQKQKIHPTISCSKASKKKQAKASKNKQHIKNTSDHFFLWSKQAKASKSKQHQCFQKKHPIISCSGASKKKQAKAAFAPAPEQEMIGLNVLTTLLLLDLACFLLLAPEPEMIG